MQYFELEYITTLDQTFPILKAELDISCFLQMIMLIIGNYFNKTQSHW
jgi:hypothetical protein